MNEIARLIVQGVAVLISFTALVNSKSKILFWVFVINVLTSLVRFFKTYYVYFAGV